MTLAAHPAHLDPDPSRVVAKFYLPGDGSFSPTSRVAQVVERVLEASAQDTENTAERALEDFSQRHADARSVLTDHARAVSSRVLHDVPITPDQELLLGAAFTAEFAVEGAALCNPSAVAHPSQEGLLPSQLRVAVSLRCIGEGHVSSICFAEAVIGADDTWTFTDRARPLRMPVVSGGDWSREHFRRVLQDKQMLSDVASAVLADLPPRFTTDQLERTIRELPSPLNSRPDNRTAAQSLLEMSATAYHTNFAADTPLSSRALLPVTAEENRGMEDARFVRFTDEVGTTAYRATYTAYNGSDIAARLLISPDLAGFAFHRLTGAGARNKGMALFPRLVGGKHLAVSRLDGENISLSESRDGVIWDDAGILYRPTEMWELQQLGNCGAPIETSEGWLVLTHGVGPLRTYSLGALLLGLDDPTRVIARTATPLLRPDGDMIDGYVPRVVYSCGGIVHRGTLWIPVGVGDSRIRVYSVPVDELLASMTR